MLVSLRVKDQSDSNGNPFCRKQGARDGASETRSIPVHFIAYHPCAALNNQHIAPYRKIFKTCVYCNGPVLVEKCALSETLTV